MVFNLVLILDSDIEGDWIVCVTEDQSSVEVLLNLVLMFCDLIMDTNMLNGEPDS